MAGYVKKEGFAGQKMYVMPADTLKKSVTHPLCKNLYITDIGFYPNAKFHKRERKKGCQQHILIYCTKGSGWCQINGQRLPVYPNQMLIIPKKTVHQYGASKEDPWTIYWMHFAGVNAAEITKHLQKEPFGKPMTVPLNKERDQLFEKLFNSLEKSGNMENVVNALLTFPYYLISFKQSIPGQAVLPPMGSPIEQSIAFMKSRLSGATTLKYLASLARLSVSHYSTLFREQIHHSPMRYFTFLKMQHACQLLENTRLPVKQIGAQLGYEDPFHFSKSFSKVIGLSPRAFRKR